jgi:hypothetical protein
MAIPKVNSAALAQAVEAAGPKISGFTSTLDDLSQDIRKLERMLLESGFRLRVAVRFPDNSHAGVEWNDHNQKWRIYYWAWEFFGMSLGPDNEFVEQAFDRRPLIETPIEIRLRAVEPLAQLIREIGSRIPDRLMLPRQLLLFN